jgi:hypothetical protein
MSQEELGLLKRLRKQRAGKILYESRSPLEENLPSEVSDELGAIDGPYCGGGMGHKRGSVTTYASNLKQSEATRNTHIVNQYTHNHIAHDESKSATAGLKESTDSIVAP